MKLKRYYFDKELKENTVVKLEGDEYHHLKDVMRSKIGDRVVLFNGNGFDAESLIISLNKNYSELKVEKIYKNQSEPKIELTVYQAVCKGEKLSLITQKLTELGVSNLNVFYSKFTDIKDKTSKLDKLTRVSISAAKQCGRSSTLKIQGVMSFEKMIEDAKNNDINFVAYENEENNSLFNHLIKNAKYSKIGLIIGAEGGFSDDEIATLNKNKFQIVTLGKRILRTETASIAASSLIMFACDK